MWFLAADDPGVDVALTCFLAVLGVFAIIAIWLMIADFRAHLRANGDPLQCDVCGYDLRARCHTCCPECGKAQETITSPLSPAIDASR